MFALYDCSVPCVLLVYLYIVCLVRKEEQNEEEEKKKLGKEGRIWKNVIRRGKGWK